MANIFMKTIHGQRDRTDLSPAAVVSVMNSLIIVSVMNFNTEKKMVSYKEPINLEPYVEQEEPIVKALVNSMESRTDIVNELREILKKIRTEHLNEEKKREINPKLITY